MNNCCSPKNSTTKHASLCPRCQQKGKLISLETLKSQLKPLAMRKIQVELAFYFCAQATCPIVYFSQEQAFELEQIREKVFPKNQDADCPVCYCFGFTRAEVQKEAQTDNPQILSQIKAGTQNKRIHSQ